MSTEATEMSLPEHLVRMWPVTAIDRSIKEGDMITGGLTHFDAPFIEDGSLRTRPDFCSLKWQDGVIDPNKGANGVTVEAVIDAAIGRLRAYQDTKFKCRENALAITALEEARNWLGMRREERFKRGVLNTHLV